MPKNREYFCETCLDVRGNLILVDFLPEDMHDYDFYRCPRCGRDERINRGQARHSVQKKINHYKELALKLNIKKKPSQPTEKNPIDQARKKLQDGTAEWNTYKEVFDTDCHNCNWSRNNNLKVCTWCKNPLE